MKLTCLHDEADIPADADICLQMREQDVVKLDAICREQGNTLVAVRSYGLMGILRVGAANAPCHALGLCMTGVPRRRPLLCSREVAELGQVLRSQHMGCEAGPAKHSLFCAKEALET